MPLTIARFAPPLGGRKLAAPLVLFALATVLLGGSSPAQASTGVTGDQDTDAPLVIDPHTDPDTANVPSWWTTVAYIERMPVSKRISQVTIGDLARYESCDGGANFRLWVSENPNGRWAQTSSRVQSTQDVALPTDPGRVTFQIPATTLLEGHSYSFSVEGTSDPCTSYRLRTWAHNSDQIDGGAESCQSAQDGSLNDYRMWHEQGKADAVACPAIEPTTPLGFDQSMPDGWLMLRDGGGRFVYTDHHPPNDPPDCAFTSPGYGVEAVDWRPWPPQQSQREYVCRFGYYTAKGEPTPDGWYWGKPYWPNRNGAPRDVYLRLDTIDYGALLERYKPIWAFDHDENFYPQKASAFTDNWTSAGGGYVLDTTYDNVLFNGAHEPLASAGSPGSDPFPPPLALGELGASYFFGLNDQPPSPTTDYIDARGSDEATYLADSAKQYDLGNDDIVYGRVVHDPDNAKLWVQYWLFYYDNSYETLGFGTHEGDWEMIQVGLDDEDQADSATFAAHDSAEGCDWSQIDVGGASDEQPISYVAARSHADYPHAGETALDIGTDEHRGDDQLRDLPVDSVDSTDRWTTWRGRWGSSTGTFASPPNPSEQGDKWSRPSKFHDDHTNDAEC
jgi:hypothetical protein